MCSLNKSLIASAIGTKKSENQDAVCCSKRAVNVMMVADGIGSLPYAGEAAEEVVKIMEELILLEPWLDFNTLYERTQMKLEEFAKNFGGSKWEENRSFGTTLITVIEEETQFRIGYLGNGAIIHIRSDFMLFETPPYIIPWSHSNYLNPHSIPVQGKESLTRYFALPNTLDKVRPTALTIEKDNIGEGDILVICTDGIYSQDQEGIAKDGNGELWREERKSLKLLYDCLRSFISEGNHTSEHLEMKLQEYLEELKVTPMEMDDDCSIAVIITDQALKAQEERNGKYSD